MISHKSVRSLGWIINFGAFLHILPFYWSQHKEKLVWYEPMLNLKLRKLIKPCWFFRCNAIQIPIGKLASIVGVVSTLYQFGAVVLLILLRPNNMQTEEVILGCFFASACLVGLPGYAVFLLSSKEYFLYLNELVNLEKATVAYQKTFVKKNQKLDSIIVPFVLFPALTIVFGFPSCLWATYNELPYFRLLKYESIVVIILNGAHLAIMYSMLWTLASIILVSTLIHSNMSASYMSLAREQWINPKPDTSRAQLLKHYRAHQILHYIRTALFNYWNIQTLPICETLIITSAFSAINFSETLPIFTTVTLTIVSVCLFLTLKLIFEQIVRSTEASIKFLNLKRIRSWMEREPSSNKVKNEYLCLKACRPLKWKLGGTISFTKESFPNVVQNIFVTGVADLLLLSKQ